MLKKRKYNPWVIRNIKWDGCRYKFICLRVMQVGVFDKKIEIRRLQVMQDWFDPQKSFPNHLIHA